MNPNLDDIISRHLDGELTPAEQTWLIGAMSESPEVAMRVHDAVLTARAARRTPVLHQPSAKITHTLFQSLATEGLYQEIQSSVVAVAHASQQRRRIPYLRTASLVTMIGLLAAVVIGDGAFSNNPNSNWMAQPVAIVPALTPDQRSVEFASLLPQQRLQEDAIPVGAANSVAKSTFTELSSVVQGSQQSSADSNLDNKEQQVDILPTPTLASAVQQADSSTSVQSQHLQQQIDSKPVQETDGTLSVSASSGIAYLLKGAGTTRQETTIKVTLAFNNHSFSIVGGYSPKLREVDDALAMASALQPSSTTSSTDYTESVNTGGLQRESKSIVATQQIPESAEPWLGIGYNYGVALHRAVEIVPGIVAGAGTTSWRVGAELPMRYHVTKKVSLELVAAANYVRPYPQQGSGFDFTDDANRYHYYETSEQAAFTAVGARLGVVVKMSGND